MRRLARCALLCNDASLHHDDATGWSVAGDSTEGALLSLALALAKFLAVEAEKWLPRRQGVQRM